MIVCRKILATGCLERPELCEYKGDMSLFDYALQLGRYYKIDVKAEKPSNHGERGFIEITAPRDLADKAVKELFAANQNWQLHYKLSML